MSMLSSLKPVKRKTEEISNENMIVRRTIENNLMLYTFDLFVMDRNALSFAIMFLWD